MSSKVKFPTKKTKVKFVKKADAVPVGQKSYAPNPYREPERDPNRVFKYPAPPPPPKPVRPRIADPSKEYVCTIKLPPRPCQECKRSSDEKATELLRRWGGPSINWDAVDRYECAECGKQIEVRTPEV